MECAEHNNNPRNRYGGTKFFSDGTHDYKCIKQIGTWGPDNKSSVFEVSIHQTPITETSASEVQEPINILPLSSEIEQQKEEDGVNPTPNLALKVLDSKMYNPYVRKKLIAERSRSVHFNDHNIILPIKKHFEDVGPFNAGSFCTVLPFHAEVSSLRCLMYSYSRQSNNVGLPEDCIAVALRETLLGLADIHKAQQSHRQLTAGNIFFHRKKCSIRLAFADSVYELFESEFGRSWSSSSSSSDERKPLLKPTHESSHGPEPSPKVEELSPMNEMLDWARGPEVDIDPVDRYGFDGGDLSKTDIWLFGIAALELAYGGIRVRSRNELLKIAFYIGKKRKLLNTWEKYKEEVLSSRKIFKKKTEVGPSNNDVKNKNKKVIDVFKNLLGKKKKEERFSDGFSSMVALCFVDVKRRPTALELLEHKFFMGTKSLAHFKNVVLPAEDDTLARS